MSVNRRVMPWLLFLSGCTSLNTTAPAGRAVVEEFAISSFHNERVAATIEMIGSTYSVGEVLFVFDVDNTILRSPEGQFFGGDEWYRWQSELDEDNSDKLRCLLDVAGLAYYMSHLQVTEANHIEGSSADFVRRIQATGYDTIALTARGYQYRYQTERELEEAGIDFSGSQPEGRTGGFVYRYRVDQNDFMQSYRDVSYQNGIIMSAGQHKGAVLFDLLRRLEMEGRYHYIVFFDDRDQNINAMLAAAELEQVNLAAFYYQGVALDHDANDLAIARESAELIVRIYADFNRRSGCDI